MGVTFPSERSRVAVFCRHFLPRTQTFVYDAVHRLRRYRATVFCAQREEREAYPHDDVRVGWLGYRSTTFSPNFAWAFMREPFDVVHAQFGTAAVYALPYAKLKKKPLVISFHGYDVPLLDRARRFRGPARHYAWLGAQALHYMTVGLCVSAELRDMLIARGVPASKLRVHLLGVDTKLFCPPSDPHRRSGNRVLMIGRLVEKKGFSYGISAFARASTKRDASLTLVGEGPLDAQLRAQVRALGIESRVCFTGALPHQEVLKLLQEHDVLLAPSVVASNGDRDSGLMVLREAAACGLVPIATRRGGLPDSVEDGTTGFLVEERDVGAMAARLEQVLADSSLRRRLSAAGRQKMVKHFDHTTAMKALEDAYDEARRSCATSSANGVLTSPPAKKSSAEASDVPP